MLAALILFGARELAGQSALAPEPVERAPRPAAGRHAGRPLTAREDELKAAYLYNVAKFVDWPQPAPGRPDEPFTIGVLGDDPLAKVLEKTLVAKLAQGRAMAVRRFRGPADLQPTHILYLGTGAMTSLGEVLGRLAATPVLTVSMRSDFIHSGGTLNFYVDEETLRFEICLERAEKLGLKISSKLLRLARIVKP